MSEQHWLATSPLLVPLATSALTLMLHRHRSAQQTMAFAGAVGLLLCAIAIVTATAGGAVLRTRFGDWAAPFAIEFRIDRASAVMLVLTALLTLAALVYEAGSRQVRPIDRPLLLIVVAAAGGAYATADLFNLYVWFEVMLMGAVGLLVSRRPRDGSAAMTYLVLNVFGTVLLLVAIAGLYGLTGQLNLSALAAALAERGADPLALTLVAVLVAGLLIKSGAVPFHWWLPAAYPLLPPARLALFTGLTSKVGVYAILRVMSEVFPGGAPSLAAPIGWVGIASMAVGALGAVYHYDLRKILAFHSVSQIGYVLLAIALGGTAGAAAALFFVVHHVVIKANLYLLAGMIATTGSFDLRRTGGLYRSHPGLALLFGLTAAALVGLPPLSGFWAKLLVVKAGIAQEHYAFIAAALATSALTLLSMTKIWLEAFWKPREMPMASKPRTVPPAFWLASASLAALALILGLLPASLLEFVAAAAAAMHAADPGARP